MLSGQQILRLEEQINGFRLQQILGRDIDSRLIFKAVNYKKVRRVVKILQIKQGYLDQRLNQALFYCQVDHPNLTKTYDFMIRAKNRQMIIFMEYCDENLAENNKLKTLEDQVIDDYAKTITQTIHYLHQFLNVAHCDVRLESIQLTKNNDNTYIPRISFYNVTTSDSIPPECYLPFDFAHQHEKQADIWSLGLLLLELYSKKRITDILPQLKDRWKPAYKAQGFNSIGLFQSIRNYKIRYLLRDILQRNAKQRPEIRQIIDRLGNAIAFPQFQKQPSDLYRNPNYLKNQDIPLVHSFQRRKTNSSVLNTNPITTTSSLRQKHTKNTSHKQMCTTLNSDIFRLTNIKDRSKVKIINLSNMKIVKIEQIYGVPCLQWLYLENNFIEVIQNIEYSSLQGLNLGSNRISKIQNLQHLTNLTELYLQNNKLTIIQNLHSNTKLKWLYLNDNGITEISTELFQLKELKIVALKNNAIDMYDNLRSIGMLKDSGVDVYV